jgi:hypothetical protein
VTLKWICKYGEKNRIYKNFKFIPSNKFEMILNAKMKQTEKKSKALHYKTLSSSPSTRGGSEEFHHGIFEKELNCRTEEL